MSKQLKYAEGATPNSFHCLTHDCPGFCEIVGDNVKDFECQLCGKVSCILCQVYMGFILIKLVLYCISILISLYTRQVIHVGITCEDYRNRQVQDENKNLSEAALLVEFKIHFLDCSQVHEFCSLANA